jgi:cytochrome c551/c552/cytochrome c553
MCRFIEALGVGRQALGALALLVLVAPAQAGAQSQFPGVGRPATPAEIKAWDIDVRPDFRGLPPGSGSVERGQKVWDDKCASCHGTFGESNEVFTPIVGGTTAADIKAGRVQSLVTGDVARSTLMKLPTLSTLWDYINRAMPWNAPKTLSTEEVYAVVAYILNLGDIVPNDFVLSDKNIAEVQQRLPNRNGMTRNHGLWDIRGKADVVNVACMKDCPTSATPASELPEHAKGAHGNLAEQQRTVGATRGADTTKPEPPKPVPGTGQVPVPGVGQVSAAGGLADLAKRKACLSCHGTDKRIVGPSFKEIGARYKGRPDAEAHLVQKLRTGGSGTWGPIPMPPNPDLAADDARKLIQWILSGV